METAMTSQDGTDYTDYPAKVMIRFRIDYLIRQLNHNNLNKKQERAIKKELNGYGIIVLRAKAKKVTLMVGGDIIYNFTVAGKKETTQGTIIGYLCNTCLATSNIRDFDALFEPDIDGIPVCLQCYGSDVRPIYGHNIIV